MVFLDFCFCGIFFCSFLFPTYPILGAFFFCVLLDFLGHVSEEERDWFEQNVSHLINIGV